MALAPMTSQVLRESTAVTSATVSADTFALSESGPLNYTAGNWSCVRTGTNTAATMPTATSVTVPVGDDVTCTINNNDNGPALHLRKTVTNDNGGTALATAWTLTANGTGANDISGTTPVDSGASLKADTFALSESGGPSGYTPGNFSCIVTGSDNPGPATPVAVTNGNVTLGLGDDVTCTINNNDNGPALHLRKTVTNDNGGTALATAWTLTANGTGANDISGTTPVDSGASLKADTFALSESGGPSGYTPGNFSCIVTGSDNPGPATPVAVTNGNVTLGLGDDVTCTINNNDNGPALHLRKTVTNDNGGTALATAWTLTANGTGANDISGTTPVDSGASLKADTFALSESGGPFGLHARQLQLHRDRLRHPGRDPVAVTNGNVTLGLGDDVTCTINNNDNGPALHLRKTVTNDNGGTAPSPRRGR